MKTRLLEGRPLARAMREDIATRVQALPGDVRLAVVLVGDDPGSRIYSESIQRSAGKLGITAELTELDPSVGGEAVADAIESLDQDPDVSGIILQRPLPAGLPEDVAERISPDKDVDCATALSMGLLVSGRRSFAPCTAEAVLEMLSGYEIPVSGSHVVIVGRSMVVGKPLANMLLKKHEPGNATVTVCHTGTKDLGRHIGSADILVAAMGRPEAIRGDAISGGAVVIDVGVNRVEDPAGEKGYRVVGDVAFDEMMGRASAITPVPGGVGTMTTTLLLRHVLEAAERRTAVS